MVPILKPVTFPWRFLSNKGDVSLVVERVRLIQHTRNLEFLGAEIAGPRRRDNMATGDWPDDLGDQRPAEGTVIQPFRKSKRSSLMIVGVRLRSGKRGSFRGIDILYRVGKSTFRLRTNDVFILCAEHKDRVTFDCPEPQP